MPAKKSASKRSTRRRKNLFESTLIRPGIRPGGGSTVKAEMAEPEKYTFKTVAKKRGRSSYNKSKKKTKARPKKVRKTKKQAKKEAFNTALQDIYEGKEPCWPGMEESDEEKDKNAVDDLLGVFGPTSPSIKSKVKKLRQKVMEAEDRCLGHSSKKGARKHKNVNDFLNRAKALLKSKKKVPRALNINRASPKLQKSPSNPVSKKDRLVALAMSAPRSRADNQYAFHSPRTARPATLDFRSSAKKRGTLKATLPLELLRLYKKFKGVESIMSLHIARSQFVMHMTDLQKGVESLCKRKFDEIELARLITLVPELYIVEWSASKRKVVGGKAKHELSLTLTNHLAKDPKATQYTHFLNDSVLAARMDLFYNRLQDFVKQEHLKWCAANGMEDSDPRCYQPGFAADSLQIPPATLPEKPVDRSKLIQKQMLHTGLGTRLHDAKLQAKLSRLSSAQREGLSSVMKKAMALYEKKKCEVTPATPSLNSGMRGKKSVQTAAPVPSKSLGLDELDMSKVPVNMRHLDRKLLLKIQGRAKARAIMKEDSGKQNAKLKLERLTYLVTLLRGVYVGARKTAMPMVTLLSKLQRKHKDHPPANDLKELFVLLNNVAPNFLSIVKSRTEIVKVNTKLNATLVYKKIKEKVNT